MLFNLQGAHRFQRRAFILPQRFFFVKHFFQVFSNSFALSFADLVAEVCCPHRQLIEDITLGIICQALFSSFPNWISAPDFSDSFRKSSIASLTRLFGPLPKALANNSKIPPTCQHLFSSFLIFFHILRFCGGFLQKFHLWRTFGRRIPSCGSTFLVIPLIYPHNIHIGRRDKHAH